MGEKMAATSLGNRAVTTVMVTTATATTVAMMVAMMVETEMEMVMVGMTDQIHSPKERGNA